MVRRLVAMSATLSLVGLLAAPGGARAQEPARINVDTYTLPNGLQVILAEDHSAQVVQVDVWYHVGSRNEVRGRTGFAHLFEHMMFQGSANVAKAQHSALVTNAGGINNGSTTEDRTNFFEELPSNRLNLGLWLEAEHMRSLAVTKENFENQRQAVKEERRLRVDNQPYLRALFEDDYGIYDSTTCFPYAHSVIGSMADLDAAQVEDVQRFYKQYYTPNNATLAVVGDFTPADAKKLIQEYFGDIPRGATPAPVECAAKFNTGPVRRHVTDVNANLPAVVQVFRVPEYRNEDYAALELLQRIVGGGESSRFNRSLVREKKLAVSPLVLLNPFGPRNDPGVMLLGAIANQGVSLDSLNAGVTAEIARLASGGVTDAELAKAKNSYRAGVINARQSVASVAEALQTANQFLGNPNAVNGQLDRYMKVTTADIKRVASTYLRPDNSLTLLVSKDGK